MIKKWKKWRFKNTTFLILSLAAFYYFLESTIVQVFLKGIGELGYFGSFISGILFVSTFTVAPASAILFDIAKLLNPYFVAITAGLGAVLGDYLLLRYFQDKVFDELKVLLKPGRTIFGSLFSGPLFAWLIPIIGAIIIASPFPDEVGIGMIGLSKIKKWQFLLITFVLNSIGIFIVIGLANSIR